MDKLLKIIFVVYTLIICFLSFYPIEETPTSDKLNHFIAFFVFAVLLKVSFKTGYFATFFYSLLFGTFIEFVQYFLPFRSCEFADIVADSFGALSGLFSYFFIVFGKESLVEFEK